MTDYFKELSAQKKIGVAFPAGFLALHETSAIKQGLSDLQYKVVLGKNFEHRHGYLAGGDSIRAEAFMELWKDPSIGIIWCAKGGYGSCRILDRLDFGYIRRHPKILIGMSDITALHSAFSKKVTFPTFLGPNLSLLFGKDAKTLKMRADTFAYLNSFEQSSSLQEAKWINPGRAQAPIVGGNLCVLTSLIGTMWQPNFQGKILLIEEVNEAPYRIDRMLFQLEKSGSLRNLQGVILASFENCIPNKNKDSLELEQIFKDYFGSKNYPVVQGIASGHLPYQQMIPLGKPVLLDSEQDFIVL
jgi:muramoyltetrapeptide carboxypeptidase